MKRLVIAALAAAAACSPVPKLTESEEYYAGRAIATDVIADFPLYPDMELQRYVNFVGFTVAFASERPELFNGWTFGVIESDKINAVAGPGGFIFLTTAMVRILRNEDELAAVLAHEIAHVCKRHPELAVQAEIEAKKGSGFFKGVMGVTGSVLRATTGSDYAKELAALTDLLNDVSDYISNKLWKEGYEREQEYEADLRGLDYITAPEAGYDPNALADVLERMAKLLERESGLLGGFFSSGTHPDPMARVRNVRSYIDARGYTGAAHPARTRRFEKHTASLRE